MAGVQVRRHEYAQWAAVFILSLERGRLPFAEWQPGAPAQIIPQRRGEPFAAGGNHVMRLGIRILPLVLGGLVMTTLTTAGAATPASKTYQELLSLFAEWRAFERPPLRDGAPDYTANTFKRRHQELKTYEARLAAIDPRGWPVEQQVDYQLVRAEMNGLDFYIRVLQPWARDPAFYKSVFTEQSDTPAHEGPTQHAAIELWTYSFPLSAEAQKKAEQRASNGASAAGAGAAQSDR